MKKIWHKRRRIIYSKGRLVQQRGERRSVAAGKDISPLFYVIMFLILFAGLWLLLANLNTPNPDELRARAVEAFDLINQERSLKGLTYLEWDPKLEELAAMHSYHMAETGDFTHSGFPFNECITHGGTSTGSELYEVWHKSPSHQMILLKSNIRYGAIAIQYKVTQLAIGDKKLTIDTNNFCATFLAR